MKSIAKAVRIRARVYFSRTNVATTREAKENPTTRIVEGRPSRYITIKKEKNTSARPVSLCIRVNAAGNKTILAAINCALIFVKSVSGRERYFANARHTQILQNSAG